MSLSQTCWCLPALLTFPACTRLSLCGAPGPLASSGPSALSALPSSRWLSWCSRPGSAPQTFAHSRRDQSHPAAHWDCLRWETVPVQSTAGSFRGFCIWMYTCYTCTQMDYQIAYLITWMNTCMTCVFMYPCVLSGVHGVRLAGPRLSRWSVHSVSTAVLAVGGGVGGSVSVGGVDQRPLSLSLQVLQRRNGLQDLRLAAADCRLVMLMGHWIPNINTLVTAVVVFLQLEESRTAAHDYFCIWLDSPGWRLLLGQTLVLF